MLPYLEILLKKKIDNFSVMCRDREMKAVLRPHRGGSLGPVQEGWMDNKLGRRRIQGEGTA